MECLRLENVGMFYGDLEYIKVIWYILSPFGYLLVHILVYFPCFGTLLQDKSGNRDLSAPLSVYPSRRL
jgi:hypothetical protein